jgi:hypothetical protein
VVAMQTIRAWRRGAVTQAKYFLVCAQWPRLKWKVYSSPIGAPGVRPLEHRNAAAA